MTRMQLHQDRPDASLACAAKRLSGPILAAVLAACGGGTPEDTIQDGSRAMAARVASLQSAAPHDGRQTSAASNTGRRVDRALGVTDATRAFLWLEQRFPEVFRAAAPQQTLTLEGMVFVVRYYPTSDAYLAVSGGTVYALGAFTGHQVLAVGPAALIACTIDGVGCPVTMPAPTPPVTVAKPRNNCTSSAAPQPGDEQQLNYRYSGSLSGRVTLTTTVGDPITVQGHSVLPIEAESTGSVSNGIHTATLKSTTIQYQTVAADGTITLLGNTTDEVISSGTITQSKLTRDWYNPGVPDSEFTLRPGEFVEKNTTISRTQILPTALPTSTSSYRTRHFFDRIETVTILGRTYQACRYAVGTLGGADTTNWLEVGTGKLVRMSQAATRSQGAFLVELEP